ncbi:MAG: PEP-CTERM sorting domain-containing protein [Burkholderiales bacterium]|nr:PEP-CTERM sorting domain-containing protein [Burkholderiales bacterium]
MRATRTLHRGWFAAAAAAAILFATSPAQAGISFSAGAGLAGGGGGAFNALPAVQAELRLSLDDTLYGVDGIEFGFTLELVGGPGASWTANDWGPPQFWPGSLAPVDFLAAPGPVVSGTPFRIAVSLANLAFDNTYDIGPGVLGMIRFTPPAGSSGTTLLVRFEGTPYFYGEPLEAAAQIAVVPEPSTWLLLLGGLAGLGVVARRRSIARG